MTIQGASEQPSPEWSTPTRRIVAVICFLLTVILAWRVRTIFPLVIVAMLIAYILNPIVTFLADRVFTRRDSPRSRRGLATLATTIIVLVVLIIFLLVFVPELIDQLAEFGRRVPGWVQTLETTVTEQLSQPIMFGGDVIMIDNEPFIPLDRLEEATGTRDLGRLLRLDELDLRSAATAFFNSARNLSGPAFNFLGGAFSYAISVTFLFMMTYYLLNDGPHFADMMVALIPESYQDDANRVLDDIGAVWDAYLRGQLILSVVIGVAVYFAALLVGLPNAIILGLISGLLEFIPNLGPLIALIPAALLALVSQSTTIPSLSGMPFMIVVIIIWTMIQNVEAVLLVPRIMGDSLDLHPFVVIIAVMGGAAIGGALGVIVAAPFVASARVLARYTYGKLTGRSPFKEIVNDAPKEPPTLLAKLLKYIWKLSTSWFTRWRDRRRAATQ